MRAAIDRLKGLLRDPRRLARALRRRLPFATGTGYDRWVKLYDTPSRAQQAAVARWSRDGAALPWLAVHVFGNRRACPAADRGLERQLYCRWERVDVPAGASFVEVAARARGEYLVLLDAGTEPAAHALAIIAREVTLRPGFRALYGDCDDRDPGGSRCHPDFKPDWSPELLLHLDYVDTPLVVHLPTVRTAGCDQPHPTAVLLAMLRAAPDAEVRHVPYVLGHRHETPTGALSTDGLAAVAEHVRGAGTQVSELRAVGGRSCHRLRYGLPRQPPAVSVLVPTRDRADLLRRCIDSLRSTVAYRPLELVVIDNGSTDAEALEYLAELASDGVAVLRDDREFNYSRLNNLAARHARGSVLLLLNNDVEAIEQGWLEEIVALAQRPNVGAVGARLLSPDGRVQHGGVVLGALGLADHAFRSVGGDDAGMGGRLQAVRECGAVTAACLGIRREVFTEVGGFDEELPVAFNDVDLCLRIRRAGYSILWTPHSCLLHAESASRGTDDTDERRARWRRDVQLMRERWREAVVDDPYYSPNLSLRSTDGALAFPPRAPGAWGLFR